MPSVSITWHTMGDDRVCPICQAIEGYTWIFENEVPNSLIHPAYGEVWNTSIGSAAHEHGGVSTCRCHIEPQFQLSDLLEALTKLKNRLEAAQT